MGKRLFIFGNGFDLAHGIKSNYSDFRDWLINKYTLSMDNIYDFDLPCYQTNYKRLESYDESEFAEFFIRLIDEAGVEDDEWRYFEDTLGKIDWSLILNNVDKVYDKEGDMDPWKTSFIYSDIAQTCGEANHILRIFFRDWIVDINESLKKVSRIPFFNLLSNENSIYLSFNYTNTLEELYSIENVCHIHGDIDKSSAAEKIIIGHGQDTFSFEAGFMEEEAYEVFETIFHYYYKNTMEILSKHKAFFDNLRDVNEVYLYGLSFGDVDDLYFEYIFGKYKDIKKVYLNSYNHDELEYKKNKIINYGFTGEIVEWD